MPAIQTTYSERMPVAFEGMVANEVNFDIHTRICETDDGIAFGRAVSQGTADKGAVIGGTLANFVGITVRDITQVVSNEDKYGKNAQMGVLVMGHIWVKPAAQVSPSDPVHYVQATGVFTNTGAIGPIVGAAYMSSADAEALARVHLAGVLA